MRAAAWRPPGAPLSVRRHGGARREVPYRRSGHGAAVTRGQRCPGDAPRAPRTGSHKPRLPTGPAKTPESPAHPPTAGEERPPFPAERIVSSPNFQQHSLPKKPT
ncbi:unnamed protein product [Coccothraustes coccothraustes]